MNPSPFPAGGRGPIIGADTRGSILEQCRPGPQARETILAWMRPVTIKLTRQRIVLGENQPFTWEVFGAATVQPMRAEELELKPEGDRSWKWSVMWATTQIILETNDDIEFRGVRYKVMGRTDWAENGFLRYELTETYRKLPEPLYHG